MVRRGGRDQPIIVAVGRADAQVHARLVAVRGRGEQTKCQNACETTDRLVRIGGEWLRRRQLGRPDRVADTVTSDAERGRRNQFCAHSLIISDNSAHALYMIRPLHSHMTICAATRPATTKQRRGPVSGSAVRSQPPRLHAPSRARKTSNDAAHEHGSNVATQHDLTIAAHPTRSQRVGSRRSGDAAAAVLRTQTVIAGSVAVSRVRGRHRAGRRRFTASHRGDGMWASR